MATTQVKHFDDGGPTDPYSPDYVDPYAGIYDMLPGEKSGITPDGNGGYIDAGGNPVNADGTPIASYSNEGKNYTTTGSTQGPGGSPVNASNSNSAITDWLNSKLGTALTGAQIAKIAAIGGGGIAGLVGAMKPNVTKVGYQGKIPELQANRTMVTAPPRGHVPGSGGINWGGDVTYTPKGTAAPAVAATGINPNLLDQVNQQGGMAQGGIAALAHGGSAGQYLQGSTDGMADKLPTTIDGKQPAALSHGEFVVPADVVSHLGNGNSDAGAKKLYSMMDKIRQARTGTKKQGKQINPDKFMPGGLAQAYAAGGSVRHFVTGGATDPMAAGVTGSEQAPASWAGDYLSNMLAQGQALATAPYQQYQGPLTAGASDLQNTAFTSGANLQAPASLGTAATTVGNIANKAQELTYTPQTTAFDTTAAKQYMNPYLQQSLNPQLDEARRQSDITAQQNNAQMTKAGAFGGGRQAILTAENQRNLGTNLANITGQGYNTAYTNAQAQFNADQNRKSQEAQFGATYANQGLQTGLHAAQAQGNLGLQQNQANIANTQEQANLGATQRGITSEGIAADQAAFNEARANPYKMLQFQQSLVNGLPITANNYQLSQPSATQSMLAGAGGIAGLLSGTGNLSQTDMATLLKNLGLGSTTASTTTPQ